MLIFICVPVPDRGDVECISNRALILEFRDVEVSQSVFQRRGCGTDGSYSQSPKVLVLVRDVKLEGGRQRHPSGGVSAKEMVIGLEGVELGADGKVRRRRGNLSLSASF